ncbi:MAG: 1,6-anhydro-N-acetylmuramyl-L-alanine amidase AmpD [Burkholderiales bacterium]|jgi:AmpD protein|nr:1,6-anhydro-N-acetylmuramyl-L-alanine amidase AmpD [Burkholderiales bacterium]
MRAAKKIKIKPLFCFADSGIVAQARWGASPNVDDRPMPDDISLIVIHNISLPPARFGGKFVTQLFTNTLKPHAHPFFATLQGLRVSAHFFIRRNGALIQFVDCARRAWHAGASTWQNKERCNDFSIGIELEGTDTTPYRSAQYKTLNHLLKRLITRYPITAITGHETIAPQRKSDPGAAFLWRKVHVPLRFYRSCNTIYIKR